MGFKNTSKSRSAALWNLPFVFLNLSFFLLFSNIAFLYLYPIALEAMGIGHHKVGLVLGSFSAAAVLSRPFLGKLVIEKGEFAVIVLGLSMSLTASLSYIFITEFGPAMLFIRVLHGLGFSAFISAGFSLAAKTVHSHVRGEAFSIIGVSLMGAIALAPYLGELLIGVWGFFAIYGAAAGCVVLAGFTTYQATRSVPVPTRDRQEKAVNYLGLLKEKSFVFLLVSTLIFSHCQATVLNFLALISQERGVSAGRFFLVSNVIAIVILLSTGKLIDRFGKLVFMRLSYPVFALGILFIPEMIGSALHTVPAVLYGIGVAMLFSTHNAIAAGHGENIDKPAVMSLFTTVYDIGYVTGAIVSGWYAHMTSLDVLYWTCGMFCSIGLIVVVVFPIKEK